MCYITCGIKQGGQNDPTYFAKNHAGRSGRADDRNTRFRVAGSHAPECFRRRQNDGTGLRDLLPPFLRWRGMGSRRVCEAEPTIRESVDQHVDKDRHRLIVPRNEPARRAGFLFYIFSVVYFISYGK
jgi:hypothetical protein